MPGPDNDDESMTGKYRGLRGGTAGSNDDSRKNAEQRLIQLVMIAVSETGL